MKNEAKWDWRFLVADLVGGLVGTINFLAVLFFLGRLAVHPSPLVIVLMFLAFAVLGELAFEQVVE